MKIRARDSSIIPLKLNKTQLYLDDVLEQDLRDGKPVRMIILKARQEGVSTWSEARLFHLIHQRPNSWVMVVSHDDESSETIFQMSRLYYEMLPKWVKPVTRYSNRKELVFDRLGEQILNSRMQIESALSRNIGRGWTLQGLHVSELAFWPPSTASELLVGLLQAVPEAPGTMVFIESTANGLSGEFYDRFWLAYEGKSSYRAVFIPWFWEASYSKPLNSDPETFAATLTAEEKHLIAQYGLTLEQINWRRHKIIDDFKGDVLFFLQEFPSNPYEAFVSRSKSVFDREILMQRMAMVKDGKKGELTSDGKFIETKDGRLTVWKFPEKDHLYLIGADVSEGIERKNKETDYSCADVLDIHTLEQVAQWHGKVDPDVFASELIKLGNWYNKALLAPEYNNHGIAVVNAIVKSGYPYIYHRREYDNVTKTYTPKIGWRTTAKTKPLMIDALIEHVRDGTLKINSGATIKEMLTFVRDARGRMGAEGNNHDDRVIALAIAVKVWEEVPKRRGLKKEDIQEYKTREQRIWEAVVRSRTPRHEYLGELF